MDAMEPEKDIRISNGISIARIIAMLWIFSVNYFLNNFRNYYGVEPRYATEKAANFINLMNSHPWFIDRFYFIFSYAGWSGVITFVFLSGFSLWFSILKSGRFNVGDYGLKRFLGIYPAYFVSIIIAGIVVIIRRSLIPQKYDLAILLMGAVGFVDHVRAFNSPVWFITTIFLIYLFFPIIPILYKRFRFIGILVFTLVCSFFMYNGPTNYMRFKESLYPLVPFWVFMCIGVLISHIVYKYLSKNKKLMNPLCILTILTGIYFLFRFIYLEPASNLQSAWEVKHRYVAGVIIALVCFSMGYLLPLRFYRVLRWFSRGTFAVFLYHYIFFPFLVPCIKPSYFSSHISIVLIAFYFVILICLSVLQGLFDEKILIHVKRLFYEEHRIE